MAPLLSVLWPAYLACGAIYALSATTTDLGTHLVSTMIERRHYSRLAAVVFFSVTLWPLQVSLQLARPEVFEMLFRGLRREYIDPPDLFPESPPLVPEHLERDFQASVARMAGCPHRFTVPVVTGHDGEGEIVQRKCRTCWALEAPPFATVPGDPWWANSAPPPRPACGSRAMAMSCLDCGEDFTHDCAECAKGAIWITRQGDVEGHAPSMAFVLEHHTHRLGIDWHEP